MNNYLKHLSDNALYDTDIEYLRYLAIAVDNEAPVGKGHDHIKRINRIADDLNKVISAQQVKYRFMIWVEQETLQTNGEWVMEVSEHKAAETWAAIYGGSHVDGVIVNVKKEGSDFVNKIKLSVRTEKVITANYMPRPKVM